MLLSLKWLREFVPFEGTAAELGDKLTMLGLELEEIIHPFKGIEPIVIGRVLTCEPHPESDHLSVCTVDVNQGEPLNIVCGAPNVRAGILVPVVLVGTTMPNGMVIKKTKLRGYPSHGMICSERELGLGEDHDGIMILPESFTVGQKLVDALDLDMEVCDIAITPNRADCLSVLGLAREVAMAFNLPLTLPELKLVESGEDASGVMAINIPDAELCPVFQGRVLEGATVGKSPAWLRYRLIAIGLRPISNLVDVTNYILMELGQPLHAYDLDTLKSGQITVSCAAEGEKITTLDGNERVLNPADLLIRDGEHGIGLAGVMGGLETEISDASTRVFLEAAVFRPGTIRKTARRLGLSSDASYRFERGVDQVMSRFALDRAAQLMCDYAGATARPNICVAEPKPWTAPVLTFRIARAESLLGIELDAAFCHDTLTKLGCTIDATDPTSWKVLAPSHRSDFEREADLIEEIARVRGMDTIPPVLPKVMRPLDRAGAPESEFTFNLRIKHWGAGLGLNEAINYSFVGQKDLDHLHLPEDGRIAIMNPLTAEQNVLRTELAPGLLNNLRQNIAQGNNGLRIFEVAHIFDAKPLNEDGTEADIPARERNRLGILMYGALNDAAWPHHEADAEYVDLKGVIEHLFQHLHLGTAEFSLDEGHPFLLPCVAITLNGQRIGELGRVKPDLADAYHARKDVWFANIDLDLLQAMHQKTAIAFAGLQVYPR